MNILQPKEIEWQTCNLMKTYFESYRGKIRFLKDKACFWKGVKDCGFIQKNSEGSLSKSTPKGYLLILGVDFKSDSHEIDLEGGGWPMAARSDSGAVVGHCHRRGAHRSSAFERFQTLIDAPRACGDSGGQRELTKGILGARGRLGGGRPRDLADVGALHMFDFGQRRTWDKRVKGPNGQRGDEQPI